jgi:FkbM family methyltransferase
MIIYSGIYKQNIKTEIDFIFTESVLKNAFWEKNICNAICSQYIENTEIIDVGANIGLISLGINIISKEEYGKDIKKIHCFECNYSIFEKLAYNVMEHNNIHIYQFGLSDKSQIGTMAFNTFNNDCSFVNKTIDGNKTSEYIHDVLNITGNDKKENVFISLIKLDDLIEHFTERVSVIKVDIEGFEYFFLLGAKKFIEKHFPTIIIEIMPEHSKKINDVFLLYNYKCVESLGNENYMYQFSGKMKN